MENWGEVLGRIASCVYRRADLAVRQAGVFKTLMTG